MPRKKGKQKKSKLQKANIYTIQHYNHYLHCHEILLMVYTQHFVTSGFLLACLYMHNFADVIQITLNDLKLCQVWFEKILCIFYFNCYILIFRKMILRLTMIVYTVSVIWGWYCMYSLLLTAHFCSKLCH